MALRASASSDKFSSLMSLIHNAEEKTEMDGRDALQASRNFSATNPPRTFQVSLTHAKPKTLEQQRWGCKQLISFRCLAFVRCCVSVRRSIHADSLFFFFFSSIECFCAFDSSFFCRCFCRRDCRQLILCRSSLERQQQSCPSSFAANQRGDACRHDLVCTFLALLGSIRLAFAIAFALCLYLCLGCARFIIRILKSVPSSERHDSNLSRFTCSRPAEFLLRLERWQWQLATERDRLCCSSFLLHFSFHHQQQQQQQ